MTTSPAPLTASVAHAEVLAALHHSAFAAPWEASTFVSLLADPSCQALILQDATNQPVAFVLYRLVLDEAEIITIATHAQAQRQGWGRRTLDAMTSALRQAGAMTVFLEVAEDNDPAQALYRRYGFVQVGRRKGYYPAHSGSSAPRDALVLSLTLE